MRYTSKAKWNILFEKSTEWISFRPELGAVVYPCYVCKTMFSSKESLLDHVNRRVLLIKYDCHYCLKKLIFYNRCAILLHTRLHYKLNNGKINLDNIEMGMLPVDLAGFHRRDDIPLIYDDDDDNNDSSDVNATADDDSDCDSQFYQPLDVDYGRRIVKMTPCNVFFYNPPMDSPQEGVLLVLRQIKHKNPMCRFRAYTPDTATTSSNNSRLSKCPECQCVQKKSHFKCQDVKKAKFFECPSPCGYFLPSQCAFQAHQRLHQVAPPFICPECGIKFNTDAILRQHMDNVCFHLQKQVRYKCPAANCRKLYGISLLYSQHIANHIRPIKEPILADRNTTTALQYKCSMCQPCITIQKSQLEAHIAIHIGNYRDRYIYVYACSLCKGTFNSSVEFGEHRRKYHCTMSSTSTVNDANKRKRCLGCGYTFPANTLTFECPICNVYFVTGSDSKITCLLCKTTVLTTDTMSHLTHCKYLRSQVEINEENEPKRRKKDTDFEGNIGSYRCHLCSIKIQGRTEFHDHIIKHRDVSTAYQCMDCGQCFVVKPSLEKHLIHYHKILDTDLYMSQNDCFHRQAVAECQNNSKLCASEHLGPILENQCTVCMQQFENAQALSVHFKVHGLPFVMRKTNQP